MLKMQNYIEISSNFYLKRKKIFWQLLHDFLAKKSIGNPTHYAKGHILKKFY